MAKRYCDTQIWEEDWFILMPPMYKLLWSWITNKCDHAGVWKPNLQSFIKFNGEVDLEKAIEYFNDEDKVRLIKLKNGKYFLPGFFVFQYGEKINLNNKVHKSIYQLYKSNEVNLKSVRGLKEVIDGLKDKDKEKDIDNIKEGAEKNILPEESEKLMCDLKITDCKPESKSFPVIESGIKLYAGFKKAFPNNRDLPLKTVRDWIPPVRMLIEKKGYTYDQIGEVMNWAIQDKFWRTTILDTEKLEKNFEQLKQKYQNV